MSVSAQTLIESVKNWFLLFIKGGNDDAVIDYAKRILSLRLERHGINALEDITNVKEYVTLWFADEDAYKFCCLYLDQSHRLIQCHNIFRGSSNHCNEHAKEISRLALVNNASSVIFSCHVKSTKDFDDSCKFNITSLQKSLKLINVRVIDHLYVSGSQTLSFKEKGFI